MKPSAFRWNDWNLEHATRHGVSPAESEAIVLSASRPWPEKQGPATRPKWMVQGRGVGGRVVQVVYVVDPDDTTGYIIHAMPLTTKAKARAVTGRGVMVEKPETCHGKASHHQTQGRSPRTDPR